VPGAPRLFSRKLVRAPARVRFLAAAGAKPRAFLRRERREPARALSPMQDEAEARETWAEERRPVRREIGSLQRRRVTLLPRRRADEKNAALEGVREVPRAALPDEDLFLADRLHEPNSVTIVCLSRVVKEGAMKFRTAGAIVANVKNGLEVGSRWAVRAWKACDCGAAEIFLFFVFAFVGIVLFVTGFYVLEHTRDWVPPLLMFVLATVFFVHALLTFAQIARRRDE
jgi:hypothetical protein